MNRIVKVHERISSGFLTPFIFILSYTFEDKYKRVRDRLAVIRSRKSGVPHLSDSIIRKNGHRMVSCQATFPFPRIGADETPFPEQFRPLSASLISLYGFRLVKRSPAGRPFKTGAFRHGSIRFFRIRLTAVGVLIIRRS